EVPPGQAQAYGSFDVMSGTGATAPVRGIVEKPKPGTAPSNLAVIGRYILQPTIFGHLSAQSKGAGGEIQLTDAIAAEIMDGAQVFAHRFSGTRFDCGSKQGFLQATVSYALANPDLRDEFAQFLSDVLALQKAAE
ncbi:MAG: UTP--glucose-1-phosphate uridylyltransferase, partial [Rhodobacteraceae bacterium PARR1]